jgi:hypothetical protein
MSPLTKRALHHRPGEHLVSQVISSMLVVVVAGAIFGTCLGLAATGVVRFLLGGF